jgi:4'-phosphopantetheinyl transferase EntD
LPPNPARLSPSIQGLFPAGVIAAELRQPGDVSLLYPAEADAVRRAVPKRVSEFAAGRACARRALVELGIHDFVLRAAKDRQPIWPASVVGSITHTAGLCAAVVADRERLAAIGIDCEVVGSATHEIWDTICGAEETAWRRSLPEASQAAAVTLLFCAKEAFYKCQFPLTGEWLDFHDLRVVPQSWGGPLEQGHSWGQGETQARGERGGCGVVAAAFAIHPMRPLAIEKQHTGPVVGRFRFYEGFVMAGVALERCP